STSDANVRFSVLCRPSSFVRPQMPSLKDMRVRIASTKATQKITKAMQMVAASKLRRAQVVAEAARPYALRMAKVLGNIAAAVGNLGTAPRLLTGTGSNRVHLLLVCTAERGLCGPFNSAIVRLARERANALTAEGKEVKFFCVGRKGYEQLRRTYEKQIIEHLELRAVRTLAFQHAEQIGDKILRLYEQGAFDVCTLFFSRFKSIIAQIPTAQQIIPPVFEGEAGLDMGWRTNTSPTRMKSWSSFCRATSPCRFSALSWRMPHRSTARR